jgi:hypothetical protein
MFWAGSMDGNGEKLYKTVGGYCGHGNEDTFEYRSVLNYIKKTLLCELTVSSYL